MFLLNTVWNGVGVHLIKLQANLFLHVHCIMTSFVSAIDISVHELCKIVEKIFEKCTYDRLEYDLQLLLILKIFWSKIYVKILCSM